MHILNQLPIHHPMKKLFSTLFVLGFFSLLNAQHNCGVRHGEDTEIKARMMRNRSELPFVPEFRNTIYIPTTIHLIGSSAGGGFANQQTVMEMLCRLNEDFADQNILFYLNGNVRYVYNDFMHSDSYSWGVMSAMGNAKVPNSLNIFVNANVSEPVAGYYSPSQDFVWMGTSYANGISTTITHEIGHFFTLPHTFYGWEGVNAPSLYSLGPSPSSVNGHPVENVARNNCLTAGDGFCDTGADYISYRHSCPISTMVQDPTGAIISPDPSYYMSYSSDECMTRFSQDQKNAMRADITARGWLNQPPPPNTTALYTDNISPIFPQVGELIVPAGNVRFEWDTIGASAATRWIFKLERTVLGVPVEMVHYAVTNGQSFTDVAASLFISNRTYQWSVSPFSVGYTCAGSTSEFTFRTGVVSGAEALNTTVFKTEIFPNPANSGTVQLKIASENPSKAVLRIFSTDGRLVLENNSMEVDAAVQTYQLDISNFAAGLYTVQVVSEAGVSTHKLVVEGR